MCEAQDQSNATENSTTNSVSFLRYSTNKAGMDGLDKETITKIIVENSKGSKFYENELRKERFLQKQISQKLEQLRSLKAEAIKSGEIEADKLIEDFERRRRFNRCVVHVDMDAFYAAVEIRDQPELRVLPVAVGSISMLSTSNYIARRFGVRAGLPGFLGKKLCPNLHIIPPDFARYTEASRAVRAVLSQYAVIPSDQENTSKESREVAMVTTSLDEAYLDLTLHLTERQSWAEERRSYWPRPAPGAKMLVCRCPHRRTKTSRTNASGSQCGLDVAEVGSPADQKTTTQKTEADEPAGASVDMELAVCDRCGYLLQSGRRVFGTSAWEAVREIRFRVFCATRLTCSAGIGPNTLIAKIASDWSKPMGQFEVPRSREAVNEFMHQMPVRKVPGIGHVTERRLDAFGVHTCGELLSKRGSLWHLSTLSAMSYYLRIALGHSEDDWLPCSDPTLGPIVAKPSTTADGDSHHGRADRDRKSMSVERTFADCSNPDELFQRCRQLAAVLSSDLKEEHAKGRHLTLKLKLDTFENRSRSQTLPDYTNETEVIATFGIELLREEMIHERTTQLQPTTSASEERSADAKTPKPLTLRLMGLRMATLMPAEMCPQIRQRSIEEAMTMVVQMQPPKSQPPSPLFVESTPVSKIQAAPQSSIRSSSRAKAKSLLAKSRDRRNRKAQLEKRKSKLTHMKQPRKCSETGRRMPFVGTLQWSLTTRTDLTHHTPQPTACLAPTASTIAPVSIFCPVCEKQLQMQSEEEFNHHLDACLSRDAIAEAVRETLNLVPGDPPSTSKHQSGLGSRNRLSFTASAGSQAASPVQRKKLKSTITSPGIQTHGPLDKFVH